MSSTNNIPAGFEGAAKSSARLAQQIQQLKGLELPHEWDSAEGDTLTARFEATAKAMRAKDPTAPSAAELLARFENGGQSFLYPVWLNQPYFCPLCKSGGAQGCFTVMSVTKGLFVTLSAAEWHAVTDHGQPFPPRKLAVLGQILEAK